MRIDVPSKSKRKITSRLKVWKLKDPQTSNHFQEVFNLHVSTSAGVADGATEDIWNIKTGLLKTTEECVAQLGHTVSVVKPGGGLNMWKRPLLPSGKLSRPGRLVKALGHHTTQSNEMPDMQCTMFVSCWWQTCEEWCRRDVNERRLKAEGLARALLKASQRWVWLGPRPPVINHQWKARPPNHHWYG